MPPGPPYMHLAVMVFLVVSSTFGVLNVPSNSGPEPVWVLPLNVTTNSASTPPEWPRSPSGSPPTNR